MSAQAPWAAVLEKHLCLWRRSPGALAPPYPLPRRASERIGPTLLPRVAWRAARSRVAARRHDGQWLVAVRRLSSAGLIGGNLSGFAVIEPPAGRSYADPFLAKDEDGRKLLFFEDQPHDTGRAVISCCEILQDGSIAEPAVVLARDYHLSYPFVFRADSAWHALDTI